MAQGNDLQECHLYKLYRLPSTFLILYFRNEPSVEKMIIFRIMENIFVTINISFSVIFSRCCVATRYHVMNLRCRIAAKITDI